MRAAVLTAAVGLIGLTATTPSLHVLRVSPEQDPAAPTDVVAITFDRPVAGSLDATVDPRTIFTIQPQVAGTVEWRDPITLRFTPTAPLTPNVSYTVTIANTFQAMDGSRLEQPHRFTFRVGGPRVLDGGPLGNPQWLRPDVMFELLVTSPIELPEVGRYVHIELERQCEGPRTVALTGVSQVPVTDSAPMRYRYAGGGWPRDRRMDALRRIVRLQPERPLPRACNGALVVMSSFDPTATESAQRWPFATYGPLRFTTLTCTSEPRCPAGYLTATFSTPVRGADVVRGLHITPAAAFTIDDTTDERPEWMLEAPLRPRTAYTVTVDSGLRDVFDQTLVGDRTRTLTTTGYDPAIDYPTGRMLVERESFRTLAVRHVNVDTLQVTLAPVPESLEAQVLAAPEWNLADAWPKVAAGATTRLVPAPGARDVPMVSAVRMPAYNAQRPGAATLTLVRIAPRSGADSSRFNRPGIALVQVTDLGIAGRLGAEEAVAWVTNVHDGLARAGAEVTLHDASGRPRARGTTDAQGLVRLTGFSRDSGANKWQGRGGFEGYLTVTSGSDRAILAFDAYSWELSPWRFNVAAAGDNQRVPAAAAVFTERGIYRPGEVVHAKAIVRTGTLGALRVPARGDSLRWVFGDREEGTLRDTTVGVSAFGTAEQALTLGADLALGTYRVVVSLKRNNKTTELASTYYRVAEYRPPEFLVTVTADTTARFAGDSVSAAVEARYLFGAPMGRAVVSWTVRQAPFPAWAMRIPGADDYEIGESGWWWEEDDRAVQTTRVTSSGTDTLDAAGRLDLKVAAAAPPRGLGARMSVQATVTDVNRQTVSSTASTVIHPAAFYLGAKVQGDEYFWVAGRPVDVAVVAVRPDGRRVPGVAVRGALIRREWHRVQRQREGFDEQVGEWVADTVARCDLTTAADPASCRFTPAQGGSYTVRLTARDAAGRVAVTSFYRWATGRGWVPWGDETQFKMDVIPDKTRYDVGDTATVLFASPFTDAEAWVTVEREGIIEQRRVRLTAGSTSIKLPLTEAHVPNAFVSIIVARGRSAPPGGIGDPGRPTIRVGYAELRVTPGIKRLAVDVRPLADEYRPGDTARVRIRVRDAGGAGRRSEVTLWAVDEGVLALTGYRTPNPVDLIYQPRGVGMRLGSNLVSVAAQVLAEEGISIKGDRAPGGGGGLEAGDVLRSRFQTTAFFLGSVITDSAGEATAAARLPDNLTTFRLMAVAVTAGDRYGSGESPMLVTRPLLARPALPRFLRRDDRFVAGVVVNQRGGQTPTVRVQARVQGLSLVESALKTVTLAAGRGAEVRYTFRDTASDTASFRFDVTNGRDSDAVLTRLPVRSSYVPRAYAAAGVAGLTTGIELLLPGDIDPERSRLVLDVGTTPLALIAGMYRDLAVYPFDCSEQVADEILPLAALVRAGSGPDGKRYAPADAQAQIAAGVAVLTRRQRTDGGIGLWNAEDWTTPWLSAHAGEALLAARSVGVAVNDSLLGRLAAYLYRSVHERPRVIAPVSYWLDVLQARLGEDVAAVDFLSRMGRVDLAGENEALRNAPQMAWEDRVRLAEVVNRRGGAAGVAARRLLSPIWANVRVEGRRAVITDSVARGHYFWSDRRPVARLLSATVAVDSANPLVGPLIETLIGQERRAGRWYWWNTQDYAAAIEALANYTARQNRAAARGFSVAAAGRVLFRSRTGGEVMREYTSSLTGLLVAAGDESMRLSLTVTTPAADAVPLFYYVTVHEVPRQRPVRPDEQGIAVERWYEDYQTGRPVVSVPEGSLVRVRLRIRVTQERQFLALTDPLPAGLEAVDMSLSTSGLPGPGARAQTVSNGGDGEEEGEGEGEGEEMGAGSSYLYDWYFGCWEGGWWSPFDHRELRDDRVAYVATYLWPGTYTATYIARATTAGVFVRPPAHAEEMYNPAVQGRSDGGVFTVTRRGS